MPSQASLRAATAGTCSFCGKSWREVKALVGSTIVDVHICDECLGLCCKILAEEVDFDDFDFEALDERSVSAFPDAPLDAVFAAVASRSLPVLREGEPTFRCSFCTQPRVAVSKLISGPRVFICDACTRNATALVKQAVTRPS
jgi:hypothetical protein